MQMDWSAPVVAVGKLFTVTVTLSVPVHPFPLSTVSVYVVVAVGFAMGFEILELLSPEDGAHE